LNGIAGARGQTLAQMAIAWVLRDPRVTSALIGARTVEQLDDSLDAIQMLDFAADELAAIDRQPATVASICGRNRLTSRPCPQHKGRLRYMTFTDSPLLGGVIRAADESHDNPGTDCCGIL
jgi:hypothetical protein